MYEFIYVVYDQVMEEFMPCFQAKNDNVAKRDFLRTFTQKGIVYEDYTLYRVASVSKDASSDRSFGMRVIDPVDITPPKAG